MSVYLYASPLIVCKLADSEKYVAFANATSSNLLGDSGKPEPRLQRVGETFSTVAEIQSGIKHDLSSGAIRGYGRYMKRGSIPVLVRPDIRVSKQFWRNPEYSADLCKTSNGWELIGNYRWSSDS